MIPPRPGVLEGRGVRLESLTPDHAYALASAVSDGRLWELWFTSVPEPDQTQAYIAAALAGQRDGHMLPWAVRELSRGTIIGSTRYHDIVGDRSRGDWLHLISSIWQRSHVNTSLQALCSSTPRCSRLQGCWLRTANFNFRAQRAIAGWEPSGTACYGITRRDATGRRATPWAVQYPGERMAGCQAPSRAAPGAA